MALIRATCSVCGDIELRSRDLTVRICNDLGTATYHFRCPICRMTTVKPADDRVVVSLVGAGVKYVEWNLPEELFDRPVGAPINHDDVLDMHDILSVPNDTWYIELLNMTLQ